MKLARPDRTAAVVLALAVLLGGMPLMLGVTVVRDGAPAFTINICHPLHSFDRSPAPMLAVMTVHPATNGWLPERGRACAPAPTLRARTADAPDPPPPKSARLRA